VNGVARRSAINRSVPMLVPLMNAAAQKCMGSKRCARDHVKHRLHRPSQKPR
jgi:hypothetical protein